jgi:anthranilate synthase component 1
MAAGVFGYIGYDMVRLMEDLPEPNPDTLGLPDAMMIRPTVMAIFDSVRDEVTVTSPVYAEKAVSPKAAYARAQERISEVVDALDRPLDHLATQDIDTPPILGATSNTTPQEYAEMIAKAKYYITAGDIFQVVLSQRFEANFTLPPFALYRSLRRVNPSPFCTISTSINSRSLAQVLKSSSACATARFQSGPLPEPQAVKPRSKIAPLLPNYWLIPRSVPNT